MSLLLLLPLLKTTPGILVRCGDASEEAAQCRQEAGIVKNWQVSLQLRDPDRPIVRVRVKSDKFLPPIECT